MALNPNPKPPRGFNRDRKAAAEILGCAPATLADQASKGEGPPYVIVGGRAWYRDSDLDAELKRRVREPIRLPFSRAAA